MSRPSTLSHFEHEASGITAPRGWPNVPTSLKGATVTSNDSRYSRVRSSYMKVGSPEVVVMARSEDDAAEATRYTAQVRADTGSAIPFSVRSGGHGISGSSTNRAGIVLDLSSLNSIEVLDPSEGLIRVGAGATWGDVAPALAALDRALTSGNFGDTGVGGLATAGGLGYFARSQGMTLDNVLRVKLLTADGTVRWVDEEHEPDLFWAVRGGATQAGIALEFEFTAPKLNSSGGNANIIYQEIQYRIDDLPRFTSEWGQWIAQAPREAVSFLMVQRARSGEFFANGKTVWANDDASAAITTLRGAQELATTVHDAAYTLEYTQIVPTPRSPHVGQQRVQMRDVLVDHANEESGAALEEALNHHATLVGEIRSMGGAIADVPQEATAWAGRHQEALFGIWTNPESLTTIDEAFAPLQSIGTGAYGAYSSDTRVPAAQLAWPGETGKKLRSISESVDPNGLFDQGLTLRN